jgi:hypothetical protein
MWVATIHRIHIGLFRIAEIRAVEADTEEFGKPFIGMLQKRLWFQSKTLPPSNRG